MQFIKQCAVYCTPHYVKKAKTISFEKYDANTDIKSSEHRRRPKLWTC